MYDLHVIEVSLKVIIAMFYFCHSNHSSNILKNIFNFISIYFWRKNFLFNKYNKEMGYKEKTVCLQKLIKFEL